MANDWRSIENDREKYAAYLCSREWAVLKEAVHERSRGICERCKVLKVGAVHHLNYERKYAEELTDLAGWCDQCHKFTHAKCSFDPCLHSDWLKYLSHCKATGAKAYPRPSRSIGRFKRRGCGILDAVRMIMDECGRFSAMSGSIDNDRGTLTKMMEEFYDAGQAICERFSVVRKLLLPAESNTRQQVESCHRPLFRWRRVV